MAVCNICNKISGDGARAANPHNKTIFNQQDAGQLSDAAQDASVPPKNGAVHGCSQSLRWRGPAKASCDTHPFTYWQYILVKFEALVDAGGAMLKNIIAAIRQGNGGGTVDWIVLAGGLVAMAFAMMSAVNGETANVASGIDTVLSDVTMAGIGVVGGSQYRHDGVKQRPASEPQTPDRKP